MECFALAEEPFTLESPSLISGGVVYARANSIGSFGLADGEADTSVIDRM